MLKIQKIIGSAVAFLPLMALAQGALENPANNSTDSGIGIISGWHCSATRVEAIIDGKSAGFAYVGSDRLDTANICKKTNTGFSLLINFNNLSRGSHNLKIYADGVLFGESNFKTTQSGGTAFLTNKSKAVEVPDFPSVGSTATLTWSQAKQSFVVTNIATTVTPPPGPGPAPIGLAKLYGKVTLNYKFNSSSTTFKDSFSFSAVNYDAVDKQLVGSVDGKYGAVVCSIVNTLGYEFLCAIGTGANAAMDIFVLNVSSAGAISGKYEYCQASTSISNCATDIALTPDGTVTGNVVYRSTASLMNPSAAAASAIESKDQLKTLQLQQEAQEPSTESATPEQLDAVLDALEHLTQ